MDGIIILCCAVAVITGGIVNHFHVPYRHSSRPGRYVRNGW